jgi:hypothetical protein
VTSKEDAVDLQSGQLGHGSVNKGWQEMQREEERLTGTISPGSRMAISPTRMS